MCGALCDLLAASAWPVRGDTCSPPIGSATPRLLRLRRAGRVEVAPFLSRIPGHPALGSSTHEHHINGAAATALRSAIRPPGRHGPRMAQTALWGGGGGCPMTSPV